jgi:nitrate reductase gamma subunit
MSSFAILRIGVIASVLFCIVALAVIVMRTFSFGRKRIYAHPQGSSFAGIRYAFGQGMLPWEKESATRHIWTYIGGILYHLGILTAMLFLGTMLLNVSLSTTLFQVVRILLTIGGIGGVGLLIKRMLKPHMKFLSSRDDYLANILIDLFLFLALVSTFAEIFLAPFTIIAIIIFIYTPFGKIRHCVFFFYSRVLFGIFFGRRGVLPHPSRKA